jgi:hypothetical protein
MLENIIKRGDETAPVQAIEFIECNHDGRRSSIRVDAIARSAIRFESA